MAGKGGAAISATPPGGLAYFLWPAFFAFLWVTTIGLGLSLVPPDQASGGQPCGRPRSNGPAIACVTTFFSRYA